LIRSKKTLYCASTLKTLSETILARLEEEPVFKASQTILLYFSLTDEVFTHEFIEKWSRSKTILLPVIKDDVLELCVYSDSGDLSPGAFDIQEPSGEAFTDYDSIDLAIVPGMAFDKSGNRLGRGKGYYDKLLPQIKAHKIGICFPFQITHEVPTEPFDIPMDKIISAHT